MSITLDLLKSIYASVSGLSLSEIVTLHPKVARRTAQRHIARLIDEGGIVAQGEGRARRYFPRNPVISDIHKSSNSDNSPPFIPTSADSHDILTYVVQPYETRKPVVYQGDFLDAYHPNETSYLPEPVRRQLHWMGKTKDIGEPAGTYSRKILNRLLIDLSWTSCHLDGNTYSRLDVKELIEYGKSAESKTPMETQMILNHKSAIEMLVENREVKYDNLTLLNLHATLAENLLPNPSDEGRIRQRAAENGFISAYRPLSDPKKSKSIYQNLSLNPTK